MLEAVESVCAGDGLDESEMLDLITQLVDKSLVVAQGGALGIGKFPADLRQLRREDPLVAPAKRGETTHGYTLATPEHVYGVNTAQSPNSDGRTLSSAGRTRTYKQWINSPLL